MKNKNSSESENVFFAIFAQEKIWKFEKWNSCQEKFENAFENGKEMAKVCVHQDPHFSDQVGNIVILYDFLVCSVSFAWGVLRELRLNGRLFSLDTQLFLFQVSPV